MSKEPLNSIVTSASSDIGFELCRAWTSSGWNVFGTYRSHSPQVTELSEKHGVDCIECDLLSNPSIDSAVKSLKQACPEWDNLVLAAGTLEPIGNFESVDFDEWEKALQVNFIKQLKIVHALLPHRNKSSPNREPCVLFFAGGGTNNAVLNYSSYVLSKIALIKMCELLDAEIPDTRFVILGPGFVNTKIHRATLSSSPTNAGENFQRVTDKLQSNDGVPVQTVIDCCSWLVTTPDKEIRGLEPPTTKAMGFQQQS